MEHTQLDASTLPEAVTKALAPGPMKMMAARGLAPLARPIDLGTVLYTLALDSDATIATAAKQTAAALPERVLVAIVSDPKTDVRVLDWIGASAARFAPAFEALILNQGTGDETVARLAKTCDAAQVDLISQNEQRYLRYPDVLAAVYMNPKARMSTVDRMVELAVRNNVKVTSLPAWEEIAKAMIGHVSDPSQDELFEQAKAAAAEVDDSAVLKDVPKHLLGEIEEASDGTEGDDEEPVPVVNPDGTVTDEDDKRIPLIRMTVPMKIRLASVGNAFARSLLVRDPIRLVAMATIKSPAVTDTEAAKYASNPALSQDVIGFIAAKREWTRLYAVKFSLILNPKTPTTEAVKMIPNLRDKDMRTVMKSKGVPSAVAAVARKYIQAKAAGTKKK